MNISKLGQLSKVYMKYRKLISHALDIQHPSLKGRNNLITEALQSSFPFRLRQVSIKNFISPHPTYSCLLPLRCLMMKENSPEKWSKLLELQSHHDEGKGDDESEPEMEGVGKFIPR